MRSDQKNSSEPTEPAQLPLKTLPVIEARECFVRESPMEKLSLKFSNGARRQFYRVIPNSNHAVMVVAMLDTDTVLITREYGCGFHRYELGLPRGRIDEGEDILVAANRELQEEAGFAAGRLDYLRTLSLAPTYMAHEIHVVLARDLTASQLEGDEPEPIDVITWKLAEIEALALHPEFTEGRALGALLLARAWLAAEALTERAAKQP